MKTPRPRTIAVLVVMSLVVVGGLIWTSRSTTPRPIVNLAALRPGTACRIVVDESVPGSFVRVEAAYTGTVAEVDDAGVRLDVRELRRVDEVPGFAKLPIVGSLLFRTIGIGTPAPGATPPPQAIAAAAIRSFTVLPN